ncbi:MAG TPA: dual specificity protein phosphatase family protein, partial [Tepidisphaeraceae bacterium]
TIWWFAGLRNRFEPVNFGVVEPGRLYRSGQITEPVIRKTLEKNHIGLIVNLSLDDTPDERAEAAAAHDLGVERVNLGLSGDGLGDPNVYPKALADIIKANRDGKAVLVHCQSGAQRTGGIIAAYRILVEGKSPDDAFAEMRQYGHDPKHNPALIPWIREHLPQWKEQLANYEASASTQPTAHAE